MSATGAFLPVRQQQPLPAAAGPSLWPVDTLDVGCLQCLHKIASHQNIDRPLIAQQVILVDQEVQYRPRTPKSKRRLNISQANNNTTVAMKLGCGKMATAPGVPDGQERTVGDEGINLPTRNT